MGLQMASNRVVAVVAESIRCLGQETEQYEFNFVFVLKLL